MKLTDKQKKFCIEYVKTNNATESAIKAGYSKKTAKEIGCENLTKPHIKEYVATLMKPKQEKEKKDIAELEEVLAFFTSVMRGEIKDQFDLDAMLRDRLDAGKELARRYEKIKSDEIEEIENDGFIDALNGSSESDWKDYGQE